MLKRNNFGRVGDLLWITITIFSVSRPLKWEYLQWKDFEFSFPLHVNNCDERGSSSLFHHLHQLKPSLALVITKPWPNSVVCPQYSYFSSYVSVERLSSTFLWYKRKATKPSSNTTKKEGSRSARSVGCLRYCAFISISWCSTFRSHQRHASSGETMIWNGYFSVSLPN